MHLQSVRELKLTLTETLLRPSSPELRSLALGASALAVEEGTEPPRSMALGITKRGSRGFALAVRVQRRALVQSDEVERIKRKARGEVDVRYIGPVTKQALPWHQRRNRPLSVGGSLGHFRITAGTLGCFVRARGDSQTLVLSNNHVLANENRCRLGDPILQPGRFDHGRKPEDVVGRLHDFRRLKKRATNSLDCAVAAINDPIPYEPRNLRGLGTLAGPGEPVDIGTAVAKVGRTTGLTRGRVIAFEVDNIVVDYDLGSLRFDNQIEIESAGAAPFSDGGDSGSLIVDGRRRAVGLLFAGSDHGGRGNLGLTYANPFEAVLAALKVDLLY